MSQKATHLLFMTNRNIHNQLQVCKSAPSRTDERLKRLLRSRKEPGRPSSHQTAAPQSMMHWNQHTNECRLRCGCPACGCQHYSSSFAAEEAELGFTDESVRWDVAIAAFSVATKVKAIGVTVQSLRGVRSETSDNPIRAFSRWRCLWPSQLTPVPENTASGQLEAYLSN